MSEPSEVDPVKLAELRETHIGRLFLRAHRDFSERAIRKLQERGHIHLSLAHTNLLAHLDLEGTHITTLADRAGITRQSMGQLVRELAEHGYVGRSDDTSDRRAVIVRFTELGWRFLEDAYAIKQEIEAGYAERIGIGQIQTLRILLSQITEGIKDD